jgi:TPR repeat protein
MDEEIRRARKPQQGGLGDMYAEGKGVPKDYVLAYMWYNLAAAAPNYSYRARNRDDLADKMSREQLAEAQRLSREWMPKRKDWLHGLWEFLVGAR